MKVFTHNSLSVIEPFNINCVEFKRVLYFTIILKFDLKIGTAYFYIIINIVIFYFGHLFYWDTFRLTAQNVIFVEKT